ncbi:ATP-binding protein [uncultured Rubinisphaera sp.]|uniref:AlbA family DNA-binding domain-containing protein n=1 Tax=uncultured Rubinisphaera sp. TaxID=1678686 RepID=UPI0030DAB060|tara:strand:- start:165 stop:770 length:606 start_codon:yes stop_codon:yes gene_type:complete
MEEKLPAWASQENTNRVFDLIAQGENSKVEFKESIPQQADKITKETVAFANSGGGEVLLGINAQGFAVKPQNEITTQDRENIVDRIMGLVGNLNPMPKVKCHQCSVDNHFVLLITVSEQQTEAAYYFQNTIYIRDHSISRPANPEEVKTLFLKWSKTKLMDEELLRAKRFDNEIDNLRLESLRNIINANNIARTSHAARVY